MKTRSILFAFLLFCLTGLNAQTGFFGGQGVPLKPQSPLFGKDIVIDNQPSQDQRSVAICSAFNGWLYALTTNYDSINHDPVFDVMRSTDSGITWTFIFGGGYGAEYGKFRSPGIVAIGDSLANLKIFIVLLYSVHPSDPGSSFIWKLNGQTGEYESDVFNSHSVYDIDLVSDYNYPAFFSNPSSLGVLYSTQRNNIDSIIFKSSSNGGISFDSEQVLATSSNSYFRKVTLNYGRSPSYPGGRYFAAWESQENKSSTLGHIYTAHSEPNFNSPFTIPICFDSIDPEAINKVRNPTIACQYNNTDNSNGSLTEVVICEKYLPSSYSYDLKGFYNVHATTTNAFNDFTVSTSLNNKLQPDINFNPYNSTFMLTYFDSTELKLPFLSNDFNFGNPNGWNIINQAYNDNTNLLSPNPKVNINFKEETGMNTWISEGTGGNGIAMFDSPYSTYTGVSENNIGTSAKLIGSYPNPCSNNIKIAFELKYFGKVIIEVMNIMGQTLGTATDQNYPAGKHIAQYDVSNLPEGNYLYKFNSGEFSAVGKFAVVR
jgi:hypothetical protein